jgi:hypothetical protein
MLRHEIVFYLHSGSQIISYKKSFVSDSNCGTSYRRRVETLKQKECIPIRYREIDDGQLLIVCDDLAGFMWNGFKYNCLSCCAAISQVDSFFYAASGRGDNCRDTRSDSL